MGANLKEVRVRIKSVMSTQQITKAMKMVSASKLRRAQQAIQQFRPYSNKMNEMLTNILAGSSDTTVSYGVAREVKNVCIVVVTSNKGLCGAFNTNVNKAVVEIVNTKYAAQLAAGKITFLCIGKKGAEFAARRFKNCTVNTDYMSLFSELTFDNTAVIGESLMTAFKSGEYDAIEVAYGQFKNAAMQNFVVEPFLPVAPMETTGKKTTADFEFEPSKTQLLETMVPSILKMQLFKCCLDTHASEHGARMTSMDKATENANELLKDLRINYNKARQEAITKELSEIVGGAIALEG
jgi:F-type H+-transporting ATPase subunit gamma